MLAHVSCSVPSGLKVGALKTMELLPIIETAPGFFMKPSGRSTEELLTAKIAEKAAEDAEKRAGIFSGETE